MNEFLTKKIEETAKALSEGAPNDSIKIIRDEAGNVTIEGPELNHKPKNLMGSPQPMIRKTDKLTGPNDKCPCDSGKKFKRCCMGALFLIALFLTGCNEQHTGPYETLGSSLPQSPLENWDCNSGHCKREVK